MFSTSVVSKYISMPGTCSSWLKCLLNILKFRIWFNMDCFSFQAWWNGYHHRGGTEGVWRDQSHVYDSAGEPDYAFQVRTDSKSIRSFLLGHNILEIRFEELKYVCIFLLECNTTLLSQCGIYTHSCCSLLWRAENTNNEAYSPVAGH